MQNRVFNWVMIVVVSQLVCTMSVIAQAARIRIETTNQEKAPARKISDEEIQGLVTELYKHHWEGAEPLTTFSTTWAHHITDPIHKFFVIGHEAQDVLLNKLSDTVIKEQVIYILGGIGN